MSSNRQMQNDCKRRDAIPTVKDNSRSTSSQKPLAIKKPALPKNFPPEAKAYDSLVFPDKENEDNKGATSAHKTNVAIKKTNLKKLIFKNHPPDPSMRYHYMPELETVMTAFAKLYNPDNVPTMRAYFDYLEGQGWVYVGTASRIINNWEPNRHKPLLPEDIQIDFINKTINKEIAKQKDALLEALKKIAIVLRRRPAKNASIAATVGQHTKNVFNFFRPKTAVNLKDSIKNIIQGKKIDYPIVDDLLSKLLERKKKIALKKDNNNYQYETRVLNECIEILEDIVSSAFNDVITLEKFDQCKKNENLILEDCPDNEILHATIDNKEVLVSAKELKNYRIVKNLAVGLVTRYDLEDTDGHNLNFSKFGPYIDCDMSLLRILFQFRKTTLSDQRLRKPNENTFIITEYDIANFPDIEDADFYYWVTKQTWVPEYLASSVSWFQLIPENRFRNSDNEVFKALARNPVFVFHKYLTLTKLMCLDENIHRNIAKLHMRDLEYEDIDDIKNKKNSDDKVPLRKALDEITADRKQRIKDKHDVLIKMRMYQKIINKHGNFVYAAIKKQLDEYRNKKINKLAKKPHYKDLIESLDPDKIKNRFDKIKEDVHDQQFGERHAAQAYRVGK